MWIQALYLPIMPFPHVPKRTLRRNWHAYILHTTIGKTKTCRGLSISKKKNLTCFRIHCCFQSISIRYMQYQHDKSKSRFNRTYIQKQKLLIINFITWFLLLSSSVISHSFNNTIWHLFKKKYCTHTTLQCFFSLQFTR